ncbi:MAG: M14 family zinc carboxypeptidase [Armatimonadota bacterium]
MTRWAISAVLLLLAGAVSANPYAEAMHTVRVLSDSSCVRLLSFGKSHNERDIPAFVLSDFTIPSQNKARILICAGQHGDEFDPVKSVLALCKSLTVGSDPDLLKRCAIIVIPMVNPDGVADCRRVNGVDVDINRDWIAMTTRESRFVNGVISAWKPNLLIDVHNWNEPSSTPGNAIEAPNAGTGERASAMTAIARHAGASSGLSLVLCHPYSDKRLFHRHYCSLGYAAYLLETQNNESFDARCNTYKAAIKSLVMQTVQNQGGRYVLSPASMQFKPDSVSTYLDPAPNESTTASSMMGAFVLAIACVIIVALMKPFSRNEQTVWSRRYILCAVDPEIGSDRLVHRHAPHPITARSWVNRRLRSRYAPAEPEDEADKPDNTDQAPQIIDYAGVA